MRRTVIKEIYHKIFPWQIRYRIYRIPYNFAFGMLRKKYRLSAPPLFKYIEIETVNRCNGRCSFCPVNARENQRPYAKMEESLFEKIIDELSEISYFGSIALFSNNEPFLDNRIAKFAETARRKVPKSYIVISTNGILLDIDCMNSVLPYIDRLIINNYSTDGKLKENIAKIKEYISTDKGKRDKVVIDLRNENEVLTTRGGQSPNNNKIRANAIGGDCPKTPWIRF